MEQDPRRWIGVLRASHDRLAGLVETLEGSGLARQSMATEWSVAKVLSHLGSGAEIAHGALEAAMSEQEPPRSESYAAVWERWNAMSPEDMATGFVAADERLVATYEGLDSAQLGSVRIPMSFLPEPLDLAAAAGFRLNEHALHSWDVFASFDPSATVAADATELLIDQLPMMVGMIANFMPSQTRPAETVTLYVETTSPSKRYHLTLGDAIELIPTLSDPDSRLDTPGVLTLPSEALLRLTSGRLKPELPMDGVELSGPLTFGDLRRAFPGY